MNKKKKKKTDKIPRPYLVAGINPWVDTVDPPLGIPGEHQRNAFGAIGSLGADLLSLSFPL